MTTRLSVIIVSWNTRAWLAQSLESVYAALPGAPPEVFVVDNGSTDGSQAMLAERFPQARLLQNTQNVGFAKANNQAARLAAGDFLLLLNSDAFLDPNAVDALMETAAAGPSIGLVGAQLRFPDGRFQASFTPFPTLWREFLILSGLGRRLHGPWFPSRGPETARGPQPVDYVEGACMLVRRQAYEQAGGLSEDFFMYAEDVEFCYRLRRLGWQVWYQPQAVVTHVSGASSRDRRPEREGDLYRSRVLFFRQAYGPAAARRLKLLILSSTLVKSVVHRLLRLVSGGRRGRPVVSWRYLLTELNKA